MISYRTLITVFCARLRFASPCVSIHYSRYSLTILFSSTAFAGTKVGLMIFVRISASCWSAACKNWECYWCLFVLRILLVEKEKSHLQISNTNTQRFPIRCVVFLQDTPLTTCPGCPVFPHAYTITLIISIQ